MDLLIIFLIGLGASFFGSFMSGGLAMLAISGLLAVGLSPLAALGVFRVGTIGFSIGGLYKYIKAQKVVWNLLPAMLVVGIIGSIIGAKIVISVDESLIEKVIGVVILILIPIALFKPRLGIDGFLVSTKSRLLGHVSYFLASVWGGSIAVGTGLIVVYPLMHFYGLTLLQVKGTNRIPSLLKNIVVLVIFEYYGLIDWEIGIIFAAGMLLGSWFGTHYAIKIGDTWLRYILLGTIILFSLKIILGY